MVPQPTVSDSIQNGTPGTTLHWKYNKNHRPGTEGNLEAIFSFNNSNHSPVSSKSPNLQPSKAEQSSDFIAGSHFTANSHLERKKKSLHKRVNMPIINTHIQLDGCNS